MAPKRRLRRGKLNLSGGEMAEPDPSKVAAGAPITPCWVPLDELGYGEEMRLSRALPLLMILSALALAACGSDSSSDTTAAESTAAESEATAPPAEETTAPSSEGEVAPSGDAVRAAKVTIGAAGFEPPTVTIEAGGKVIWQNQDAAEHTVVLDDGSFDSGPLGEGKLKSQSFKEAGTFTYHDGEDASLTGTVEVVEAE